MLLFPHCVLLSRKWLLVEALFHPPQAHGELLPSLAAHLWNEEQVHSMACLGYSVLLGKFGSPEPLYVAGSEMRSEPMGHLLRVRGPKDGGGEEGGETESPDKDQLLVSVVTFYP